ncbi:hypothetical protein K1T35_47890 (plasmid) [Pseudonocardia sp. DSM 110487]|uniref:hypothetical protein n=1 Tax=Pseudonocardia sp. DSM 110487 TaxID=2865833 RepID=UPI001C694790|nr:hypothetical protein [Pseudonocardia sp. DSM 110487]QYN41073.1 hypothetical protein K1T35_47890 [Pseudonocardia sp. DSM 110487]
MRSRSDDELYALQNRYLGPPGRTLLWQARYAAYVLWAGYAIVFLILRAQLGLIDGFLGYAVVVVAAVLATQHTMRVITPERPTGSVLKMFVAELDAPRRDAQPATAVADPRHVLVSPTRPHPRQGPQ